MNVFEYIQQERNKYETQTIPTFEGYEYSQYKTINRIDHYWVDTYIEGDLAQDKVIGHYPFDNISKYRVLLEARATDFDTKDMEVGAKDGSRKAQVAALVGTKALQNYMRKIRFGEYLNTLCITRPKYGGAVTKRVNGVAVVPWENLITDQSDIETGIIIERHYFTPAELKKQKGWKNIDEAISTALNKKEKQISGKGKEADTMGDYIEVFELHGDIPLSLYKESQDEEADDGDEHEYIQATVIVCGIDSDKYEDAFVLYASEEKERPYRYLARNPIPGQGLGEGVVQQLFEHQKWHNFSKTEELRMVAIAGKKLYLTDDPDVLGNVFDEGVDHGTVLRVSQGKTFTELNQIPTGFPVYTNMRAEWDVSADKSTSSYAAKTGEEAPSGTPFRAQYLQNLEASSQFDQYREEIGLFLKGIIQDWILPDALKDAGEDLYESFNPKELQMIDETIVESEVTDEFVKRTLNGEVITPQTMDEIRAQVQAELRKKGNKRTINAIKKFIGDVGKEVIVFTTNEGRDKAVLFESYANILGLLAPNDPRREALIDRIMSMSGVPKEELELYQNNATQAPQTPQASAQPKVSVEQLLNSRPNQLALK